jgi:hypothetical protein
MAYPDQLTLAAPPGPAGRSAASGMSAFAGVSVWRKRLCRAECNKAPSTYEMEGALPGLAAPDRPVARLPQRCAPPARTRHPRDVPVSRCFSRPGVASGWRPFPTVRVFLLPPPVSRKGPWPFILRFFLIHIMSTERGHLSALGNGYPLAYAQPIHRLPGVIRGIRANRRRM